MAPGQVRVARWLAAFGVLAGGMGWLAFWWMDRTLGGQDGIGSGIGAVPFLGALMVGQLGLLAGLGSLPVPRGLRWASTVSLLSLPAYLAVRLGLELLP